MISTFSGRERTKLTDEMHFGDLGLKQRSLALAAARTFFVEGRWGAKDKIDLPRWQAAAADERERLLDDSASAAIVRELDLILALKN
ncbi:MAG: hypothetical protein K2W96_03125 [Gemmataceae bacterium]|nr:hypothetical protein [Gemmataceae bacterium]